MRHPSERNLALYSGGDLPLARSFAVRIHLGLCSGCRSELKKFRDSRSEIREAVPELPAEVDWRRLAADMAGNIRVGLEAGECVGPAQRPGQPHRTAWRIPVAACAACVFMAGALWLGLPEPQANHLIGALRSIAGMDAKRTGAIADPEDVLDASRSSIGVRRNGASFRLLAPHSEDVTAVSMSLEGSATASYVDADSGQVTVNKVYDAQ